MARDEDEGEQGMSEADRERILPDVVQAVVCDMDGLLLDSEAAHWETMRAAARELGYDFPDDLFLRTVGVDRPHNRILIQQEMGPDFPLDRFYNDSDVTFKEMIRKGLPLRPGVHELFDALDRLQLRRAVATSTGAPFAQDRLRYAGILDRVDVVVTLNDVARPKPFPDPYLRAVDLLGATPSVGVALEDSHNGVRSASAAGLTTIMVPDLLPPTAETERMVAATLPSLADVADLLLKELA